MIQTDALTVRFDRRRKAVSAIQDVGLRIHKGELVAILGPSGSGKSTLLNVLGTLLRPTSGRVCLDGQDVYALSAHGREALRRERIGFVFQTFHLIPYLTAAENIAASLALRGYRRRPARMEAAALLERMNLPDRADHLPDDLSVGERQRVALARAVAGGRELLLADEPTGNLDPDSAAMVFSQLTSFRAEGTTVVVVTHDPAAAAVADRTIHLRAGRIVPDEAARTGDAHEACTSC